MNKYNYKYTTTKTIKESLDLISSNRADVLITPRTNEVDNSLSNNSKYQIIASKYDIDSVTIYHYLHIKNKDIVQQVNESLKILHSSGKYNEIINN